jgi:UDP-N-acetylmuramyl tripeptide synthase
MSTLWTLSGLLEAAGLQRTPMADDPPITGITDDSRNVEPGNLFVALRGSHTDSHLFISDAVERGAVALVVDADIPAYGTATIVRVDSSPEALGRLAHAFHGDPTAGMTVFGVSGTNGKTTTSYILKSILEVHGQTTGLIGTIHYIIKEFSFHICLTCCHFTN